MSKSSSRLYRITLFCLAATIVFSVLLSVPVLAENTKGDSEAVQLDGSFDDWANMPEAKDKAGDEDPQSDIVAVKWFPDVNSSNLYLYCERLDGTIDKKNNSKAIDWNFQVDFNTGAGKRTAYVQYHPEGQLVKVAMRDERNELIFAETGKWGEDKYTANRVEFYIPLSCITGEIKSGYQFDMNFLSIWDRAPDTGFITVSTAGTLPWLAMVLMFLWVVLLMFLNRQGMHFFKFIAGSVGFFVLVMMMCSTIGENFLQEAVTRSLWLISQIPGTFGAFPGYSMITVNHALQAVSYLREISSVPFQSVYPANPAGDLHLRSHF